MVDAGPEPTYEEKMRVPPPLYPLGKIIINIFFVGRLVQLFAHNFHQNSAPEGLFHPGNFSIQVLCLAQ